MTVFAISFIISLVCAFLGFIAFFDFIQLFFKFPRHFVYSVFNYRIPLIVMGLVSFSIAILTGFFTIGIATGWMATYIGTFSFLFANGFVLPTHVIFKSKHKSAKYTTVSEVQHEISEKDMVLVVAINGDAAAFPQHWIERPHVAGLNLAGQDLVMTFCGLSNLGVVFKNELNGKSMNLKVLAQLEHNLLIFDTHSQSLIEQVYGKVADSNERFETFSAVFMTFGAYKRLYPNGKIFNNPPSNSLDEKMTRMMLNKLLYAPGGHYDESTSKLAFPTVDYKDQRIGAKEKIYGVDLNGKQVAYTLAFIKANENIITETFGSQNVTVKYFEEYDFVDVFDGYVPNVDAYGRDEKGNYVTRVTHANQMLWMVWANFYPGAEVRVITQEVVRRVAA